MLFKEIIKKYKWEDIQKEFLKLYPDQKKNIKGYKKVFNVLQKIKPQKSNVKIELDLSKEKENRKPYVRVGGIERKEFPIEKDSWIKDWRRSYAIEFQPWSKWLGMEIDAVTEYQFSELEIIVHCLWEMTYCGFQEKEVQGYLKELKRRGKKCQKST